MFTEILKVQPRIENNDANAMERSLNSRFSRVAKRFGQGLKTAVLGGGAVGLALGVISKLLNPLKETQETLEKVLHMGDDAVTNAKQFGTSAGNLLKLQAFGKSAGLDPDSLNTLLLKFQGAVAEAKQDPTKQTSVRNFTDNPDIAEAFFEFIQALQKMDKTQQILVQQEVFGEKLILKTSDFLQSAGDFGKLNDKFFRDISSQELTATATKTGGLNDLSDAMGARRDLLDFIEKGSKANEKMVEAINRSEEIQNKINTDRMTRFETIKNIDEKMQKANELLEKIMFGSFEFFDVSGKNQNSFQKQLLNSRSIRLTPQNQFKRGK